MNIIKENRIIFLFGMTGVGKNYIGERLAKKLGWEFYDADTDFSAELIKHVKAVTVTEEMRDTYYSIVENRIDVIVKNTDINLGIYTETLLPLSIYMRMMIF